MKVMEVSPEKCTHAQSFVELSFSITFEFLAVGICVTNSLIGLSSIQPCKESFGYNYYNYYNIYFLLLLFLYVVY